MGASQEHMMGISYVFTRGQWCLIDLRWYKAREEIVALFLLSESGLTECAVAAKGSTVDRLTLGSRKLPGARLL